MFELYIDQQECYDPKSFLFDLYGFLISIEKPLLLFDKMGNDEIIKCLFTENSDHNHNDKHSANYKVFAFPNPMPDIYVGRPFTFKLYISHHDDYDNVNYNYINSINNTLQNIIINGKYFDSNKKMQNLSLHSSVTNINTYEPKQQEKFNLQLQTAMRTNHDGLFFAVECAQDELAYWTSRHWFCWLLIQNHSNNRVVKAMNKPSSVVTHSTRLKAGDNYDYKRMILDQMSGMEETVNSISIRSGLSSMVNKKVSFCVTQENFRNLEAILRYRSKMLPILQDLKLRI